jgi:hypothetical protein
MGRARSEVPRPLLYIQIEFASERLFVLVAFGFDKFY